MTLSLLSCNNNARQLSTLQQAIDSLYDVTQSLTDSLLIYKTTINELSTELDAYKYSPEKLCADIEKLYMEKNKTALLDIEIKLKQYHPEAAQLKTVSGYIEKN